MTQPLTLKPYTKYRCTVAGCGKSSTWTGALLGPRSPRDGLCGSCGQPMTEVVEDGHTYRVSWEMVGPHGGGWHPVHRDHTDRHAAEDQYRTLAEWERTGAEQVRSVAIARSTITFEPWDPDGVSDGEIGDHQ